MYEEYWEVMASLSPKKREAAAPQTHKTVSTTAGSASALGGTGEDSSPRPPTPKLQEASW